MNSPVAQGNRLIVKGLFGAVLGVLVAVSLWPGALQKSGEPLEVMVVGAPIYHAALILLADDQGFFARNGLVVTANLYPYEHMAMERFEQGEVEFVMTSEFTFVRSSLKEGNEDLRIIASAATVASQGLVARRDHGIAQPVDLRGKRVGVQLDSVLEYTLDRFLALHAIPAAAISKIPLSYERCVDAILKGEIDATVLFDLPLVGVRRQLGEQALTWSTNFTQPHYWPIVGRQQLLAAKPERVQRLLRALLDAQEFARAQPDQADSILIERWHFAPEFLRRARETTRLEVSLEQSMIVAMEDEANWLQARFPPDKRPALPNFLRFIDLGALVAVRPKAITILR